MLLRSLGALKIPNYREKQETLFPALLSPAAGDLQNKLFQFALTVVLIPYSALEETNPDVVFPSLGNKAIKDVIQQSGGVTGTELEAAKTTLVTLVSCEIFSHPLATALLVAATADTRCSVSDAAESRLKKLRADVNWENGRIVNLLYSFYLGTEKIPANLRSSMDLRAGSLRLLSMLLRSLGALKIPNYREKQETLFPALLSPAAGDLQNKLFQFALTVVLIPYSALEETNPDVVFPSLGNKAIKDVIQQSGGVTSAELEAAKTTLVTLVSCEIFSHPLATALLVAATADTRCRYYTLISFTFTNSFTFTFLSRISTNKSNSVSDAAESRLKKLRAEVNWENGRIVNLLYSFYLGTEKIPANLRSSMDLRAGSLRLRMKVIYGALFSSDSNTQLQHMGVALIHRICDTASDTVIKAIGKCSCRGVLVTGTALG
eukprot:sb/3464853/